MNPSRLPFPIRLPVCVAPMFLVSGPDLVVAACKAGVMGALPTTNARTATELDGWIHEIVTQLDQARETAPEGAIVGPWAANIVTHSSNARLAEDLAVLARYRPPVVITALGSPKPVIDMVHAYGGLVIADVINLTLARKAVAAGADGLACIASGAGGHTGSIASFAFISAVREFFDGILIVGGGIADGSGIAGAIAAGADCVYVGTRFIATPESIAPEEHKRFVVEANVEDLIVSAAFTGSPASWLKASIRNAGMDPDNLPAEPDGYFTSHSQRPKRWKDVVSAGQGVGAVRAIEPAAAIVEQLEQEFHQARARFTRLAFPAQRKIEQKSADATSYQNITL